MCVRLQAAMLTLLWTLKSFKRTALFFPSVIGLLIVVRLFALPKMFTPKVCAVRLRAVRTHGRPC